MIDWQIDALGILGLQSPAFSRKWPRRAMKTPVSRESPMLALTKGNTQTYLYQKTLI
ncbi:MAG: hypothetical protein M1440_10900 [Gammaproteobacteria bacterium]|nr:hypothetical protein [Gammaproteobacteria bacterium]